MDSKLILDFYKLGE